VNAFAVDLGGTHATCAIVENQRVVVSRTVAPGDNTALKSLLPQLSETLRLLRGESGLSGAAFKGIAFGFCGIVNSSDGRVIGTNGKYPDAPDIEFEAWAREEFDLPLRLENDVRMALLGERYAGAANGFEDVVMITLGTGIGGAAMIGGRLLHGKHFQAGCLGGHFPIVLDGRHCSCGGAGCAESEAAGWSLPLVCQAWPRIQESVLGRQEVNFEILFRSAAEGDTIAREIREHCLKVWAGNAVALVHAYDPEVVVFGGGVMRSADAILPYLQERISRSAWTPWGKVQVRSARLGNDAALLGAIPMLADTCSTERSNVR
jgi:glucokinase